MKKKNKSASEAIQQVIDGKRNYFVALGDCRRRLQTHRSIGARWRLHHEGRGHAQRAVLGHNLCAPASLTGSDKKKALAVQSTAGGSFVIAASWEAGTAVLGNLAATDSRIVVA